MANSRLTCEIYWRLPPGIFYLPFFCPGQEMVEFLFFARTEIRRRVDTYVKYLPAACACGDEGSKGGEIYIAIYFLKDSMYLNWGQTRSQD